MALLHKLEELVRVYPLRLILVFKFHSTDLVSKISIQIFLQ